MSNIDETSDAKIWIRIKNRLDLELPVWVERISHFGQTRAVEEREAGKRWSDDQVFEALLRAVLSNNTDWARIERVLPELKTTFFEFNLRRYAASELTEITDRFVKWFLHRKAGSMSLESSLLGLRETSRILADWSTNHGSAEDYFLHVLAFEQNDPKRAALSLGKPASPKKLPGLGIPIAAEALRNLGFDLCKPDRHICRAAGAFQFVSFNKWPDRNGTKPPQPTTGEMFRVMEAFELFARAVQERVTFVDNAIWLLCSRSGLSLNNLSLSSIARLPPFGNQ